jgi:hypothetical protein
MDDAKLSPAPLVAYQLNMLAMKVLPTAMHMKATFDYFDKLTLTFSNVPGPSSAVRLCGKEIQCMNFFANSLAACVFSLISYNGKVQLCAVADAESVPEPQQLVDLFAKAIDELHAETKKPDRRRPRVSTAELLLDLAVAAALLGLLALLARALA